MVLVAVASVAALVACSGNGTQPSTASGSLSTTIATTAIEPTSVAFESPESMKAWLDASGFRCDKWSPTHDGDNPAYWRVDCWFICTLDNYAIEEYQWGFRYSSEKNGSWTDWQRMCEAGWVPSLHVTNGTTWSFDNNGENVDKLPIMLDVVRSRGLTDGKIVTSCP